MAGKGMAQVVDADTGQACLIAYRVPILTDIAQRALGAAVPEQPGIGLSARQAVDQCPRFLAEPDDARAGLAVGELEPGGLTQSVSGTQVGRLRHDRLVMSAPDAFLGIKRSYSLVLKPADALLPIATALRP